MIHFCRIFGDKSISWNFVVEKLCRQPTATYNCDLTEVELGVHTCEVDIADVLEQQCAVDGVHLVAEADFSRT